MSSSLTGPCHVLQWASKSTRKLVKSSLGAEVYAFSEMIDHMALLREFSEPFSRTSPALVRHFLSIQQFLEDGELENVYWIPGTENPADGLTKLRSEMGPIMALLETGRFQPGLLRSLKGLASWE